MKSTRYCPICRRDAECWVDGWVWAGALIGLGVLMLATVIVLVVRAMAG